LSAARRSFAEVVNLAHGARVQLWSDGFYATPGLSWDRQTLQGHPFYYFAYGAAVSEVLVDTLTGESRVLRTDILHDAGRSLNPAIDIGQIEGAFIQGMGWLTSEELVWHPADGSPRAGLLATHAPSTYKIPTANDCPVVLNTRLFDRPTAMTASTAARPWANRRCCWRFRCSWRCATRCQRWGATAWTRR
jgi:xanthine dehydrogenase large subunit